MKIDIGEALFRKCDSQALQVLTAAFSSDLESALHDRTSSYQAILPFPIRASSPSIKVTKK
ncbi:hypothetical protein [Novosphingobium sp. fls2-241-R2A-195]|uniref:hypothetical protein n=1 Tax=Novosphingobium sp. fls2-241-R2A-195 TaxID=3040296 RepID=UPI00254CBB4F|nr:hypothetical protein [Novosphingobium sp. fls2-241-R2A-195]